MRNKWLCFLLWMSFLCFASCFSAQTPNGRLQRQANWNPQKTWVFFVGLLEWEDSENFPSFPQKNRRDKILLDVLRDKGVPENQIVYLKDGEATTGKIQKTFETFLAKAKSDDWVFVYYCGHGYKTEDNKETYLASYDAGVNQNTGWAVNSVPETIDKFFKGSNAIIALDNCFSGAMAEAVKKHASKISYAVLASAHFNSLSTANWTFTESLIYAFRGDSFIDENADSKITLGELIENSSDDMLFAEDQVAEYALTGNFTNQVVLVPAAAGSVKSSRLGERVEAFDQGRWYKAIITDVQNDEFKVHWFGYEYDEDALRNAHQIRRITTKTFPAGTKIEAESGGKWYSGRVLEVKGAAHLITYDGYGKEWDEWVSSKRLRKKS